MAPEPYWQVSDDLIAKSLRLRTDSLQILTEARELRAESDRLRQERIKIGVLIDQRPLS